MSTAKFLLFESNNTAKMISKKIKDGFVEIENKKFLIQNTNPLFVEKKFFGFPLGVQPLYIVKWDDIEPSSNILTSTNPEFENKHDITPEMLRKLTGLKILGNMIKTQKSFSGFLVMIAGLVSGALIMYTSMYFL